MGWNGNIFQYYQNIDYVSRFNVYKEKKWYYNEQFLHIAGPLYCKWSCRNKIDPRIAGKIFLIYGNLIFSFVLKSSQHICDLVIWNMNGKVWWNPTNKVLNLVSHTRIRNHHWHWHIQLFLTSLCLSASLQTKNKWALV